MNKTIVTIPKTITKAGELVVLPRRTYEQLIKGARGRLSRKLDAGLLESLAEIERGVISRRFSNVRALSRSLRT